MAKFRVLETSFINNALAQEGDIVEFDGVPGKNLEPIDSDGEKLALERAIANAESMVRQKVAVAGGEADDVQGAAAATAAAAAAEKVLASPTGSLTEAVAAAAKAAANAAGTAAGADMA